MTTPSLPEDLVQLIQAATAVDGQHPFSDQSLVELARGDRRLIEHRADDGSLSGAAVLDTVECELVIAPDARGKGLGTALATRVLLESPEVEYAWAHGDHPASRALAARFGFTAVRTLLQLRALELDGKADSGPSEDASAESRLGPRVPNHDIPRLSTFRPGIDDAEWLALNARAFADHEEQGGLTQRDLDDRIAAPWFSSEDFLLLRDSGGTLIAFCWLKVEDDVGEFYAVGVDPRLHGRGLGRVLMEAGFARLAAKGIRVASLYVEADNAPALSLYRRFGFTQHTIDVRYRANQSLTEP